MEGLYKGAGCNGSLSVKCVWVGGIQTDREVNVPFVSQCGPVAHNVPQSARHVDLHVGLDAPRDG